MNYRNSRLHVVAIVANICARPCVDAMSQRCSKDGEWWSGGGTDGLMDALLMGRF